MTITAGEILTAIEAGELDSKPLAVGDEFAIAILIADREVARVECLRLERPIAKPSHDGLSVEVYPSPGMPDGFSIECGNHEEAILIAEALDNCFETSYLDIVEPERDL